MTTDRELNAILAECHQMESDLRHLRVVDANERLQRVMRWLKNLKDLRQKGEVTP